MFPEFSVSIFLPNKTLVNAGNSVHSLVYLFFKFCYVNLQTEVLKIWLYVYKPLNCMQVQYIFL